MKWVLALLVGIGIGFAIFGGLQYYFKSEFWISIAVAVLGALYSTIGPVLDFAKKGYEIRKLHLEVRKLAREEEATGSLIRLPTDEELRMYSHPVQVKNVPEKDHLVAEDTVTDAAVLEVRRFRSIIGKLFDWIK